MLYDRNSRRTRLTHPDQFHVGYSYYDTGEMKEIRENPTISNVLLASFDYDGLGRRTSLTRGNGKVTSYDYGGTPFLASQTDFAGTAYQQVTQFAYNPASQIVTNSRSNDTYSWTGHGNGTTQTPVNGLNQLDVQINAAGTAQLTHDANGNMTFDGAKTFGYNARNLLTSAPGSIHSYIYYEPQGRLSFIFDPVNGSKSMDYVGDELISEPLGGNYVARRYVHGPGTDEPLVWYEGSGPGDPRYLHADERGSIIAVSDYAGNVIGVNKYDEYGMPQGPGGKGTLLGRFGYTGQAWIPELKLYYYKARMYHPELERFMQIDPIWPKDGANGYVYTSGDPVNLTDPTGLYDCVGSKGNCRSVAALVKGLNRAAESSRISSQERGILTSVAQTVGKEGDGNGVTIKFGNLGETPDGKLIAGQADASTGTITLNPNAISQIANSSGWTNAFIEGVGTIGHEARHLQDGPVRGVEDRIKKETRGYQVDSAVRQAYGRGRMSARQIQQGAIGSCDVTNMPNSCRAASRSLYPEAYK